MRNPIHVALKILEEIPDDDFEKDLRDNLLWLTNNDSPYKAPELYPECFHRLYHFLSEAEALPSSYNDEEWKIKVAMIFTGKSRDEIILILTNMEK